MTYRDEQCKRVEALIERHSVFNGDAGNGCYRGKSYPFVLQNSDNNIYAPFRDDIIRYFDINSIAWWGGSRPTTHPLSSQIACLNHLYPIRNDRDAVLSVAKQLVPEIDKVLLIKTDGADTAAFIQFEAVSDDDHLNELTSTRGSNCTSVDALIYGVHQDGRKVLLPIEWKYTESYGNDDKAAGSSGETRKERYTELIGKSPQLVSKDDTVYYFEPFYQLMRQTLWAEQMVANRKTETVKADDFVHIHVIPSENHNLLQKKYLRGGKGMEQTWRSYLKDQSKYRIVSPKELLASIDAEKYRDLLNYLSERYWLPVVTNQELRNSPA